MLPWLDAGPTFGREWSLKKCVWEPPTDAWSQAHETSWAPEYGLKEKGGLWREPWVANKEKQRGEREQPDRSGGSRPAGAPRAGRCPESRGHPCLWRQE